MGKIKKGFGKVFLPAILILSGFFQASHAQESGLWVVVKKGGPLEGLSLKEIRQVYLGDKQYVGQTKVLSLYNGDKRASKAFLDQVLKKTQAEYRGAWAAKVFQEGLEAPSVLASSRDIARMVGDNDAAIGFIYSTDVPKDGMRDLSVIYP
jgi:hypothetical protein